ncbi:hypothetical protein SAMN05421505_12128 [Sinosporangium album]|uniref:Uncharacterized protein n=1 Tax=Sinosporangium album TaxID=504805 RepID=A0A1G8ERS9_9ACTN|nr:hypothetical protein [Sinosporangium album]SDH72602.1 hypothetical protein SAMN05421505_12128 [Sinosporangium album]
MSHVPRPTESESFKFTLNSDGRPHPRENVTAVVTLLCGITALVTGLIPVAHIIASWVGVIGFLGGFLSQYISETTPERSLNIMGIVGSFVGTALGIYHGGFIP